MALSSPISMQAFRRGDEFAVTAVRPACDLLRSGNDPHRAVERTLRVSAAWFLGAGLAGRLEASVPIGYDGPDGGIETLATEPASQRNRIGRAPTDGAERLRLCAGCAMIGSPERRTNVGAAYDVRLGFMADAVLNKQLVVD